MMNIKDIKHDLIRNIKTYKDELLDTKELSLPAKKNFVDIFQGMLIANDTSLKKISEQILPKEHNYRNHQMTTQEVITNEHRISKSLMTNDYSKLDENILKIGSNLAFSDHVDILIDKSDLAKPYAKKMENLKPIADGSDNYKVKNGFETTNFMMKTKQHNHYMLYSEVQDPNEMTQKEKEHVVIDKLDTVFSDKKRLYIGDSGYSGETNINQFLQNDDDFILRLKSNRTMDICESKEFDYTAEILGQLQSKWNLQTITTSVSYNGRCGTAKISMITGFLEKVFQELTFIIITSTIGSPMILVTNLKCNDLLDAKKIYFKYLSRWKIEQSFKFMKEQYKLEKFHVRSFQSIQNIYKLVNIIFNYFAFLLKRKDSLLIKYLIEISLNINFKKDVNFQYYRIADGIKNTFTKPNKNLSECILY